MLAGNSEIARIFNSYFANVVKSIENLKFKNIDQFYE